MPTRRAFLAAALAQTAPQPVNIPGSILVHEHVLVDFIGADKFSRDRYNLEDAFKVCRPYLEALKKHGCARLQECTPNYLGRDPRLLRRLTEATGIDLWTNTGLYGARNHIFLPDYAKTETAEQLARRWLGELKTGVDGMKPRFVKIGVNDAPLHPLDRKLVEAAAIVARESGLTVASHTGGRGPAAVEQLEIFTSRKAPLAKFVWVHAQSEKDHAFHEKVARAGAWVEFDGISASSAAWHRDCVLKMDQLGLIEKTLVSQDAGWYRPQEPGGGAFRGFTYLYESFLPVIPRSLWDVLLVANPKRAFGA